MGAGRLSGVSGADISAVAAALPGELRLPARRQEWLGPYRYQLDFVALKTAATYRLAEDPSVLGLDLDRPPVRATAGHLMQRSGVQGGSHSHRRSCPDLTRRILETHRQVACKNTI